MNVEFLSTVAVIAPDPSASRELYVGALGLPLEGQGSGYHHSEEIAGCKSFGIWPLSQAAEACFGSAEWPAERRVPQVSIEFDVGDAAAVRPAAQELERAGYDSRAASTLAKRHDVDLHAAADLMRKGCSQELALQILL
jgi:hypothetical protein